MSLQLKYPPFVKRRKPPTYNAEREADRLRPKQFIYTRSIPYRFNLRSEVSGSGGDTYLANTPSSVTASATRNGITNPGWKSKIKRAEDATTPYTFVKTLIRQRNGSVLLTYKIGADVYTSLNEGLILPSTGYLAEDAAAVSLADQKARILFYKKLRKTQISLAGGVFLGELRETIQMIRGSARKMNNLIVRGAEAIGISAAKGGRPKNARARREKIKVFRKELDNHWLQLQFGLIPLISDVKDGAEAFASLLDENRTQRVRAAVETPYGSTIGDQESILSDAINRTIWFNYRIASKGTVGVVYIAGCKVGAVGSDVTIANQSWSDRFGFRAAEIVPTLWELLPWSFLIDYFTTVGDVANAWATTTANIGWYVKGVRSHGVNEINGFLNTSKTKAGLGAGATCEGWVGETEAERFSFIRTTPTGVSLPNLAFDMGLTPLKMVNIYALRNNLTAQVRKFF